MKQRPRTRIPATRANASADSIRTAPEGRHDTRAERALWAVLLLLATARVVLGFVPFMAFWGFNVHRFIPLVWGGVLVGLPILALVPAVSRPIAAWLELRRFEAGPWRIAPILAAAVVVAALPDRVWLTGDFIGRQFSLRAEGTGLAWYTHAVPMDIVLHQQLGRLFITRWGLEPNEYGRVLGIIEAGVLAWSALRFARVLDLRGTAAIAAASVVFWGGWLALFTGYNKALSEIVLLVALFGSFGLQVMREGRGMLALACVLSAGLLLHRSALAMLPALAVAWWSWSRRAERRTAERRAWVWLPLAIPAVALAFVTPQLWRIVGEFDRALFIPLASRPAASPQGETRALDLLNVLLLLCPVGLAAPVLAVAAGPGWLRSPEGRFLAVLLAPFAVLALVFYPPEGLFRFWDIFAGLGVALSLFTAWMAATALEHQRRRKWLGVAMALGAACPALAWVIHNADAELGLKRVQAYLREPPERAPALRATAHEFLGFRLIDLGRPADAAVEFGRAAEIVPSPRVLRQWATAETMSGDLVGAQSILKRIVERDSTSRAGWRTLATSSMQVGDTSEAVRSLETLVRLDPSDSTARRLLRQLSD